MIYLQKRVFDHREYSVSLGWGSTQRNAVIRREGALVDGALREVRFDCPEMAEFCDNTLQAATNNCACARLWVRNVGVLVRPQI